MLKNCFAVFFFIIFAELALHTISLVGHLVFCTYTLFGTLKLHYGNGRVVMALDSGSDILGFKPITDVLLFFFPVPDFFFFFFFANYNIHDNLFAPS